jgi:hypothetical protein
MAMLTLALSGLESSSRYFHQMLKNESAGGQHVPGTSIVVRYETRFSRFDSKNVSSATRGGARTHDFGFIRPTL